MKKIININLSGRVIPIEDSAYESLQRYIESLRRYFMNEEGRDEIINDIESRIAELMNDKVKKGAAAVTDTDIEEIIASMGRVEDFEEAEAESGTTGSTTADNASSGTYTQTGTKRFRGRLYRDSSDKILGGVCSGIASYMNVDPSIVRLLFAIITFGGFGFGIFIYILLWIILPARDLNAYVGKRLFRNPEDRVIGGVAGGLAAYFNKEAWLIRLIFAAPLLLNILISLLNGFPFHFNNDPFPNIFFGSFTGTFILAYIILWILLPEARSPFERMEMRGETVDVNSIRQNVQDEINQFKTQAQAWTEEVRTSAQQFGSKAREFAGTRSRTFAAEVAQTARPVAHGIGHAIGVLFKAFFLFVAGTIAFALFVLVLVFTLGGVSRPIQDFILEGFWQHASMWGVLVLFLAVPLIAFITWMVRRLLKVRSQNRYLGWIFGSLWLLGLVSLGIFVSSLVNDFRYYSKIPQELPVTQPANGKMIVRVDEPEIVNGGTYAWFNGDNGRGWDITAEDSLKISNIKFRVDKSDDSNYHVTIWRYSAGRNRAEATQRAQKITYSASSLDSNLILNSGFSVYKNQKFRAQKVIIEIKIPVGKMIRFDETVNEKLNHVSISMRERNRWNRDWDRNWNDDIYYSDWPSNTDYIMTSDGELREAGKVTNNNGIYEYHDNADSLQKEIERKEKQLEEDRERLQKAQDKQQVSQRPETEQIPPQSSRGVTNVSLKVSDDESMVQKINHFIPLII